jgi:hypothetical protein
MQTTGPSEQSLHFECFDSRKDPTRAEADYRNKWALSRILRTRVFVEELQIPEPQEFDGLDAECRHVLGLGACVRRWGA